MKIINETISLATEGFCDMHDITPDIAQKLSDLTGLRLTAYITTEIAE